MHSIIIAIYTIVVRREGAYLSEDLSLLTEEPNSLPAIKSAEGDNGGSEPSVRGNGLEEVGS